MTSPANELAERMEYEDFFDAQRMEREKAVLCNAVEFYSGMDVERALLCLDDQREEHEWDILLERGG